MGFFVQKYCVFFISKQCIDLGFVTVGRRISYESGGAFDYDEANFSEALKKAAKVAGGYARIVLSEELLYVTEIVLPARDLLSRESVLRTAEQSIPENFQETEWDFQILRPLEKPGENKQVHVQVVAVERRFADVFRRALGEVPLVIDQILPESYILAHMEAAESGVTVIVKEGKGTILLCAALNGSVLATWVEDGSITPERMRAFLDYLDSHKKKKPQRIILSAALESSVESLRDFAHDGNGLFLKPYNLFVSAAAHGNRLGRDEEIFNIEMALVSKRSFFRRLWVYLRSWYHRMGVYRP